MKRLSLLLMCVLVAACGRGGSRPTPAGGESLGALQPRTSQVPAGFYLEDRVQSGAGSTARHHRLDPAWYRGHGGGPSSVYTFVPHAPVAEGLSFISTEVIAFSSSRGASWGFGQLRASLARSGTIGTVQQFVNVGATPTPLPTIIKLIKHPVPPPVTIYQAVSVPTVGNEDTGFTNTSAAYAGEYVFTNQVVLFRRGRYCAIVHISGNYNQVPLAAAVALARGMDRSMRDART